MNETEERVDVRAKRDGCGCRTDYLLADNEELLACRHMDGLSLVLIHCRWSLGDDWTIQSDEGMGIIPESEVGGDAHCYLTEAEGWAEFYAAEARWLGRSS